MGTVAKQPTIQAELLSLFTADLDVCRDIVAGLVEGIEQAAECSADDDSEDSTARWEIWQGIVDIVR